MALFPPRQRRDDQAAQGIIPPRGGTVRGSVPVTNDTAMRHSAVWACLRIRADLISTFPLDVFRNFDDIRVEMFRPPVLVTPGGERWDYVDWMYASQVDLDRAGNVVGLITEVDGAGRPARIDLAALDCWSVRTIRGSDRLKYRIDGKEYDEEKVWHERQFMVAGLPVGLSPIAYAAWSIGEGLSMQDFALQWFNAGGTPNAHLRNVMKQMLTPKEAQEAKTTWRATVTVGEPLVTGKDWEYNPIQAEAMGMEWLEGRRYGITDIARFFGCPADLIEGMVAGQAITYANITQRNLQFLVMNLGPAVIRREKNLSKLLPRPRYVKLNTDALLRMDPKTRGEMLDAAIKSKRLTVTEARALDDRPPLTAEQEEEFRRLFPGKGQSTAVGGAEAEAPTPRVSMVELGSYLADAMSERDQERDPIRVDARVGRVAEVER